MFSIQIIIFSDVKTNTVTTQVVWNLVKILFMLPQKPQIKFLQSSARRNLRRLLIFKQKGFRVN